MVASFVAIADMSCLRQGVELPSSIRAMVVFLVPGFMRCNIVPLLVVVYDDRKMCACSTKSPIFSSPHLS